MQNLFCLQKLCMSFCGVYFSLLELRLFMFRISVNEGSGKENISLYMYRRTYIRIIDNAIIRDIL